MGDIYKDLHRKPCLSGEEEYTAGVVHDFLEDIKNQLPKDVFSVVDNIDWPTEKGKDFGPSVVVVFKNPNSSKVRQPAILLGADMNALPVTETAGLEYQSEVKDVMHACGHHLHTISLMTAVKALVQAKERWNGTLIACFQPGEESGKGAQGLISAGLYGIPTPDYVFGGHVTPEKAGTVSLTRGVAYSQFDSWKITMNGISGHGLRPETTVDPITMACYAVHPPSNRRLASRALARSRCPHSRANLAAQPRTSYPDLHSSR